MFISIFLVIAIPLTILFAQSYRQSKDINERDVQERIRSAYSTFESALLADLYQEDGRSYKDYSIVKTVNFLGGSGTQLSDNFAFPDRVGPFCDYDPMHNWCNKGLVGHFQVTHKGEFVTPFYPDPNTPVGKTFWDNHLVDQREERKYTRDKLQRILDSLGLKNSLQTIDSTETIDRIYDEMSDVISVRTERFSENDVNIFFSETFKSEEESEENDDTLAQMDEIIFKQLEEEAPHQPEIDSTTEEKEKFRQAKNTRTKKQIFTDTAPQVKPAADTAITVEIIPKKDTVIQIENLQSKLFNDTLVFYRHIGIGTTPIIQGFAVDMYRYLNYIVQNKLKDYASPSYAIEVSLGNQVIATVGPHNIPHSTKQSFRLAKPYDSVTFTMYASKNANLGSTLTLISGIILLIFIAVALWTIYRFIQGKMALATKRQDFVSAITHELKTPLTAIKMYAELLQNSWVVSDEKRQKYYSQIASEADRLSRLIQNVLNLSKLDGNRWNVQLRRERPKAVLDDFVATYGKNVEKQGFELTVSTDTDASNISLLIDRDAIMQILMNLVDNSLKFSKKSDYKMINIELAIKGTDMYLAVRDFGPGIPPAEMKKVFQEFYRVENEMTRQTSGTGIGLSMVKKLCTLTNLKIEVENANPGLRTKIHFPPLDI